MPRRAPPWPCPNGPLPGRPGRPGHQAPGAPKGVSEGEGRGRRGWPGHPAHFRPRPQTPRGQQPARPRPAPPGPESHREHGHEAGAEVEPILWDASGRIRSRRTAACRLCTPLTPTRPLSAPLIVGYVLRWSFFVITLCHPCSLILGLRPAHTLKALLYRCHIVSMKVCFHVGNIID